MGWRGKENCLARRCRLRGGRGFGLRRCDWGRLRRGLRRPGRASRRNGPGWTWRGSRACRPCGFGLLWRRCSWRCGSLQGTRLRREDGVERRRGFGWGLQCGDWRRKVPASDSRGRGFVAPASRENRRVARLWFSVWQGRRNEERVAVALGELSRRGRRVARDWMERAVASVGSKGLVSLGWEKFLVAQEESTERECEVLAGRPY